MYDPFFTTKAIGRGSGLGLTMCKEIIDRSHGQIRCESTNDHGTRFTVVLPYAKSVADRVDLPDAGTNA